MKVAGLMMVRNGAADLPGALEAMARYCDAICVIDDRSHDASGAILARHPAVSSLLTLKPSLSDAPWFFSEAEHLNSLYRMADYHSPDWVVIVDVDDLVEPKNDLRQLLESYDPGVVGIVAPRLSVWRDSAYPLMVPLMGRATSMQCNIWRYRRGYQPAGKRLHNDRQPAGLAEFGTIVSTDNIVFYHHGWDTLSRRVEKVESYTRLDPTYEMNEGVPYDRGLLFGFRLSELQRLIGEYRRRYDMHTGPGALSRSLPTSLTERGSVGYAGGDLK
jgi:glycosyltransferase involved in cell wall biosynthesis